jgi:tRNA (mo5U34)-methyltransferase
VLNYVEGSVYSLSPEQLGKFDLVLFFGVLYHLRYLLLAIDRIRTVSRGDVLIETHTLTSRQPLHSPLSAVSRLVGLSALFVTAALWRHYKEFELHPEDQSNWFGPNIPAVVEAFESAGFRVKHLDSSSGGTRSAFRATPTAVEVRKRLVDGTYEGLSTLNAYLMGIERSDGDLVRRE